MGLFSAAQVEQINSIAAKSNEALVMQKPAASGKSIVSDLEAMEQQVVEYFSDSEAILITSAEQLHDYVTKCIEHGSAGIDTETTGLDRINDHIVGASLYCPGQPECYIPMKHLIPIFDQPYKDQLTYEQVGAEFQRFVDAKTKLIFANADFDIAMIYHDILCKDLKVDLSDVCYFDVILAWRCIKENEKDNTLKGLYAKYPMQGKVDPKKFSDFFSPKLFPYCKPQVAKLYAANDARITYDLAEWELPLLTKTHPRCQEAHLEKISDLYWNIEVPMIKVCAMLHRNGMYIDSTVASKLRVKYHAKLDAENAKLASMVQSIIDEKDVPNSRKRPFRTGLDFNPNSNKHVPYLLDLLGIDSSHGTGKEELAGYKNVPVIAQILELRSLVTLIGTFVDKLPDAVASDSRIHGTFKQIGAATGRMASAEPNLQNIPSKHTDIRHMFRATPQIDEVVEAEDSIKLFQIDKVQVLQDDKTSRWIPAKDLKIGDVLFEEQDTCVGSIGQVDQEGHILVTFKHRSLE